MFCPQAGPWHPFPPLLSSLSSSSYLHERAFHKIIYHSSSWPASRPLSQHSSLQHIPRQSIPSKHMSYPVLLPLVYSFYETSVFIHHCQHLFITLQPILSNFLHNHISRAFYF